MFFKKKEKNYFYQSFKDLIEYSKKEIDVLSEGLLNFDNSKLLELKNQ